MIVLIGGEKGGTGKSTLVTNLAAYRQSLTGNDVLIVDTDSQGSASDWCYYRKQNGMPGIESIQLFGKHIVSEIPNKASRYDDILIDAGGRDSRELRAAMVVCDVMLVPIRASQYDIASIETISELLQQARLSNPGLRCFVVVNGLKNNPRIPEFAEAMQALQEYDNLTVLGFPIYDRMSFTRSGAEGKGVHEMDDRKATAEIHNLYKHIYGQV
jgi:chromosome partitioning protein